MASTRGPLGDFLQRKYLEWINSCGEVRSQREYADYLGLKPMTFSQYLNGKRKKIDDPNIVNMLAEKLGDELYEVLGYGSNTTISNPIIRAINEILAILPEEDNLEILDQLRKRKSGDQRSENGNTQGNHIRA